MADLGPPDSYMVEVTANGINILGSPAEVEVMTFVTQPPEWRISSQELVNGTLTGVATSQPQVIV